MQEPKTVQMDAQHDAIALRARVWLLDKITVGIYQGRRATTRRRRRAPPRPAPQEQEATSSSSPSANQAQGRQRIAAGGGRSGATVSSGTVTGSPGNKAHTKHPACRAWAAPASEPTAASTAIGESPLLSQKSETDPSEQWNARDVLPPTPPTTNSPRFRSHAGAPHSFNPRIDVDVHKNHALEPVAPAPRHQRVVAAGRRARRVLDMSLRSNQGDLGRDPLPVDRPRAPLP